MSNANTPKTVCYVLLPAHVVFLLDELGHGQLVRKLEDEFAPVRSF